MIGSDAAFRSMAAANDQAVTREVVVRAGGVCALLGVTAGLAGSLIGATHGLGGQEIPLARTDDFLWLVQNQRAYQLREWLFLIYAVFAVGEGVGLYHLTRPAKTIALWGLVAFSTGIVIGIVQDAAVVALVTQVATEYAAAEPPIRPALEAAARLAGATIVVQQAVANVLLGIGGGLYFAAVLRTGVASKWFGVAGLAAAAASVFLGVVNVVPQLAGAHLLAERTFGLVVLWDLWAGLVMVRHHGTRVEESGASRRGTAGSP